MISRLNSRGTVCALSMKAYALAMRVELAANGIGFEYERPVPLTYKGVLVLHFEPVFTAQMLTYLRITNIRTGLILNFNRPVLREGIKRFVL